MHQLLTEPFCIFALGSIVKKTQPYLTLLLIKREPCSDASKAQAFQHLATRMLQDCADAQRAIITLEQANSIYVAAKGAIGVPQK